MYLVLLFILLIVALVFSINDDEHEKNVGNEYIFLFIGLILWVGLRPVGIDHDSPNYVSLFYGTVKLGMLDLMEPSFEIICSVARLFGGPEMLFIIYALLAIPLKGYVIFRQSNAPFLTIALWLSNYFMLQESNQIRGAVVTSIFLFSIPYLANGNKWKYFVCVMVGMFFHYSAIALLIFLFMGNKKLTTVWKISLAVAPLICYAIHLKGIDPFTLIPLPFFEDKIQLYEYARDKGFSVELNVFHLLILFRLSCFYLILWKYDEVVKYCNHVGLMLKVLCCSICTYIAFAYMPDFAVRVSELYGIIDILIFPTLVYMVKPGWVPRVGLAIVSIGLFCMNIFVNEYLYIDY